MALHRHQGSCRHELRSAVDSQSRFLLPSSKALRMPKLLLIPLSNTELTYTTCAARHGVEAESTCAFMHALHGKHKHGTCAALRGARCPSLFQCSTFSAACRLVGLRSSSRIELTCSYDNTFSEWAPQPPWSGSLLMDNLLLIVSIALAYVAGIVTPSSSASPALTTTTLSDKSREVHDVLEAADEAVELEDDLWSKARVKLSKCLDGADVQEVISGKGLQLSLQALARGPRLRLLLIALEELNKEAGIDSDLLIMELK